MTAYRDGYWWSKDGLRLHYRDYAGPDDRPPILCLSGLTRNARDYEPFARQFAGRWRIIVPNMRGRGESAYAEDPMTYVPLVYLQDIEALLAELSIERFIAIGASLGGILTMLLASTGPHRIVATVLNDIGPAFEPMGIARLRSFVGRSQNWPTWLHAARTLQANNRAIYPNYDLMAWLAHAKRLCRVNTAGRIVFDYDMNIAIPFSLPGGDAGFDLWPTMAAFSRIPTLLVRGALSDLLSRETAAKMVELTGMYSCEVSDAGHAPLLDEPQAVDAIEALFSSLTYG